MEDQPTIPGLEFREDVLISVGRVERVRDPKALIPWLGKTTFKLIEDKIHFTGKKFDTIPASEIGLYEDADLKYALRYAAACEAIGMIEDQPGSRHKSGVTISATDEGYNSRLVEAWYSGNESNPFLKDVLAQDPRSAEQILDDPTKVSH